MKQSLENKIRYKAIIIYIVVAVVVGVMTVYLNSLRKEISSARIEIENQHQLLIATNDLTHAVGKAQSLSSHYITTKNPKYLDNYLASLDTIELIVDSIIVSRPDDEEQLCRIESLLRSQSLNIKNLNTQLAKDNPVIKINKRLEEYTPMAKEDTVITHIQQDTVISEVPRKRFFRRIAEVFKPSSDSVEVVVNQRVDTMRNVSADTLPIISEVGNIAQQAQTTYERNIKAIEQRVGEVIAFDNHISTEISTLLLEFHRQTFATTLSIIERSEQSIYRNYIYSTVGGVFALLLILIFIWLIINDINKGRKAREALEVANERIRQTMESRHKLLLSVSHDIKSPLSSIQGYLSMMENSEQVRSMQNSSQHIMAMLENLLEFSSLERGALRTSFTDFNLHTLFDEIYEMFLTLASQKELTLQFTADDTRINSDRIKVKQIVINLVSNAIKYTTSGGVEFSAHVADNVLTIVVRDGGVGIALNKLSELFKPFSRIEENNALASGTGLGMFVTKGLAELLDGRVGIESTLGVGTTVTATIPVSKPSKSIPHGAKRIRLYDDDPTIVAVTSDILRKLGHTIVDSECDLIITDMEMGDISGLDILRSAGNTPVVVMTGRADFNLHRAEELGFDNFLAKPFTEETLQEIVGEGERNDSDDDFFGSDRDEIMAIFRAATADNFAALRTALCKNDYHTVQALCHKMYPMFAQMGYPTEELRRIDTHRDGAYPKWQSDVARILEIKV